MKFSQKLDNFFEISARNSSIKAEIMGGLTTFFAMCYIMFVNPATMSGANSGPIYNAIFIATAIGAIVGTLLMAFYAKMPFAQASGMGLNAFFFVSFILFGFGDAAPFSNDAYAAGLSVIFVAGLVFMFLSVTGLRKKIAEALPDCLKKAIPAGIGLFIAFIGLQGANIVQANEFTLVQLVNLNVFNGGVTWYEIAPAIAAFLGFLLIGALSKTRLAKINVIVGIIATTGLYYLFNINNEAAFAVFNSMINPGEAFKDFGELGVQGWFKGFSFWTADVAINVVLLVITFCLVDMFDTLGTLQGTATEAGMLDENGNPQNLGKCLMADSTATVVGAMVGTSTVTTFVESASGVSQGAKTGLSSVVVAFMFFIAMFLSPLAGIIPGAATAPALIYVGVLMLKNFKDVDFSDLTNAIPAFLTLIMMPLTYSISNGIAVGMISYIFLKFFKIFFTKEFNVKEYFYIKFAKRVEEVAENTDATADKKKKIQLPFTATCGEFFSKDIIIFVIAVLFLVRFFMVTM